MKAWAEQLGLDDALELINMTLEEEMAADEKLSGIAEEVVNVEADVDGEQDGADKKKTSKASKRVTVK